MCIFHFLSIKTTLLLVCASSDVISSSFFVDFLNVSDIFLFVEDISEQSSANRSKEQLPNPSGTNL